MDKIRNLKTLVKPSDSNELAELVLSFSILEKIKFSNISKDAIREKLKYLREVQVPNREVLLKMKDEDVVFYWFKNWLHPSLKHWVKPSPRDKRGCSRKVLDRDARNDFIHTYENGQQNYDYTLADIEDYVNEK